MWVCVIDEPIPTYGKNGASFLLYLKYQPYYGHSIPREDETVTAIWDSVNECFYESKTMTEIDGRDIAEWWKNI